MLSSHRVFDPVSLPIPRLEPVELGFIRSVAYLFVLYYEAGEVAIPYLLRLWEAFGLAGVGSVREHRLRVMASDTGWPPS